MGLIHEIGNENDSTRRKLLSEIHRVNTRLGGAPISDHVSRKDLKLIIEGAKDNDYQPYGSNFPYRQGINRLAKNPDS